VSALVLHCTNILLPPWKEKLKLPSLSLTATKLHLGHMMESAAVIYYYHLAWELDSLFPCGREKGPNHFFWWWIL